MLLYGRRASAVVLGVAVLGLSSRTLLSRTIMAQAFFCAAAYTLRAACSLGVAVAVTLGLDQQFDVRGVPRARARAEEEEGGWANSRARAARARPSPTNPPAHHASRRKCRWPASP